MVNLVFEGCDSSGKTTLINEFTKRKRYKVFHFQKPPRDLTNPEKMEFQRKHFYLMLDFLINDDNVIFDRFHIGELIYSPLFRNYEPGYIEDLEAQMKKCCILVCVYCSNVNLLKRFDNCGIDRDLLAETNREFQKLCKQSKLNTIFIDTSVMPPKKCYYQVMNDLKTIKNKKY